MFAVGFSIEQTYEQLMDLWFGDPLQMHMDPWLELAAVDGYHIGLAGQPSERTEKLFFVNLGAYRPGEFTELHANLFVVADEPQQAKRRAKAELLRGATSVHTDDLFDVDDCLAIAEVAGQRVHLKPGAERAPLTAISAYHVIPRAVVEAYASQRGLTTRN